MANVRNIADIRRIRELEAENARLKEEITLWVASWSKAETAEIRALLELEDIKRQWLKTR